jgi:hypothetical protein
MKIEGPTLETLTRRITETPQDFLAEPKIGRTGTIMVSAVVNDLLTHLGAGPVTGSLAAFDGSDVRRDRNRLSVTLLICWLLADDWFKALKLEATRVVHLLNEVATQLAGQVAARLDCRPAGETMAQAQDRLTRLSSVERERVLKASREAEERSRAIRAALVKKAADESADKWTRE